MTPQVEQAKTTLETLLTTMGFDAHITVTELDNQPALEIDTPDQALLIGKKGENLRALQVVLNTILRKLNPDTEFMSIDIAGYKQERIEKLQRIAREAAEQATSTARPVRLVPMSAFDRRQVHTFLSSYSDIVTESEGDEPHRRIIVKKRAY